MEGQPTEIVLGGYGISVILTVVLGVVFKLCGENCGERWKALVAIILGIVLGLSSIPYYGQSWTFKATYDAALAGFFSGAGAVGLWEGFRSVFKPRS